MPSLKSQVVAFVLKHSRKGAFASPEGMNARIARSRRRRAYEPGPRIARRVSVVATEVAGIPVYEVEPPSGHADMHIIYLHGGAYCFEITPFHWRFIAEMATRLDARITVPIYPLAPEHNVHDIFGAGMATYRHVLAETPSPDIVFMGDSAGGNMAVVLAMMAVAEGLPEPGRMVLISPGLDMTLENPEAFEVEKNDPWLGIPGGLEAIRLYGAGLERGDWRISPINGNLSALPKTLILAGTRDILTPDTKRFAERAEAEGVEVDLLIEPDMFHVWPLINMPEARRARDHIVAWLSGAPERSVPYAAPAGDADTAAIRTAPSP